jgi:hypothetical protein
MFTSEVSMNKPIKPLSFDGVFRGIVVKRDDPEGEGQIGVYVPKLSSSPTTGNEQEKTEVPKRTASSFDKNTEVSPVVNPTTKNFFWCKPAFGGEFKVPPLKASVEVYFEDSDPQKPRYRPVNATIDGEVTPMTNLKNSDTAKADQAKKPNIYVIAETPEGHIMAFDYNSDTNQFTMTMPNGTHITAATNGTHNHIQMQTAGGHSFTLDDKDSNAKLTVIKDYITKTGGNLSIDVKGDASINVNGSTDINSKGPASLSSASTVTIKGSSVAIN